jgi:hypothetical protein
MVYFLPTVATGSLRVDPPGSEYISSLLKAYLGGAFQIVAPYAVALNPYFDSSIILHHC